MDFIRDVEDRVEYWKAFDALDPVAQRHPDNARLRPPDSVKRPTRDEKRKCITYYNEAVRRYQYWKARAKFPISDAWISFYFYLKSRLTEQQRQELMRTIRARQSEKRTRLNARLDREASIAAVSAIGATPETPPRPRADATSSATTSRGPAPMDDDDVYCSE